MKSTDLSNPLQVQKSPDQAPDRWLDDHGDILYRYALIRVRNTHLAEELVQETLLSALKNHATFRGASSVRTWLIAIMRNEIAGYFRRAAREKSALAESAHVTEKLLPMNQLLSPQLDDRQFRSAVEREEFWSAVQRCFEQVPEHLLDAFLFRLANPDSTIEQLSLEFDIKPSNYAVRMFRTRLLLRACLENSWISEDHEDRNQ